MLTSLGFEGLWFMAYRFGFQVLVFSLGQRCHFLQSKGLGGSGLLWDGAAKDVDERRDTPLVHHPHLLEKDIQPRGRST